jgi:hypothetical protein
MNTEPKFAGLTMGRPRTESAYPQYLPHRCSHSIEPAGALGRHAPGLIIHGPSLAVIAMKVVHPGLAWETVGWPPSATQAGAPNEHPQECAVDAARSTPLDRAHYSGGLERRTGSAGRRDLGAAELSLAGALPQRRRSGVERSQLGAAPLPAPHPQPAGERDRPRRPRLRRRSGRSDGRGRDPAGFAPIDASEAVTPI